MTMLNAAFRLGSTVLHRLDAETAHHATLKALKCLPPLPFSTPDRRLAQHVFGLTFPSPLGLAPGFDKNAEVPDAMLRLGFGFVEIGTVTPRPQVGNPRPRLFRLVEDQAVINRMGFNNQGQHEVLSRLEARQRRGIVGVNIGANKDSVDRVADYVSGIAAFSAVADYITINISSPNTPGLRGLQSADELQKLLLGLNTARNGQTKKPAMLLKIAPDLGEAELDDIVQCCSGGVVDGVIISNTTLARPALSSVHRTEMGGLSGRPLFQLATQQLARFYVKSEGKIPLIGVGGIDSGDAAVSKIEAGATLLQVYSALVYRGPGLIGDVHQAIAKAIDGAGSLEKLRGSKAPQWSYQTDIGK